MNILAINPGHNGSVALVSNGKVMYYSEEERISRLKYDGNPFRGMIEVLTAYEIDYLVIGGTSQESDLPKLPWTGENPFLALARKYQPNIEVIYYGHDHHIGHAASAFYGSGFETAVAIVVDGAGSFLNARNQNNQTIAEGYETESIFTCSYPDQIKPLYKRLSNGLSKGLVQIEDCEYEFVNSVTITKAYEAATYYLGFGYIEAGKTMGLSPYGKEDPRVPNFFIDSANSIGKGNKNLLIPNYPAGAYIDVDTYPELYRDVSDKEWHDDDSKITDLEKNVAYKIQKDAEEQIYKLIEKAIELTGEKNIVLSGGFALNCVANYKYLKRFPEVNFYIDPIAHDGGTALGLAKLIYHQKTQSKYNSPLDTLYLGSQPDYTSANNLLSKVADNFNVIDADSNSVCDLLIDGEIVCIFQGKSEAGPRALGNRSILFDPRNPKGKQIVNLVKKREWFRPFAGSVLENVASEWFEMENLKSSPFMMYAVKVKDDKIEKIPAVTHVDGTCRIQTVNREQNEKYYDLIHTFYNKTGVPIIFNTSFNLAGEPLVDNLIDVVNTLLASDLRYVYLAEHGKMIVKK